MAAMPEEVREHTEQAMLTRTEHLQRTDIAAIGQLHIEVRAIIETQHLEVATAYEELVVVVMTMYVEVAPHHAHGLLTIQEELMMRVQDAS